MKTIKCKLTITGISLVLSLVLSSCGTTKKDAVSCSEFSVYKNNKDAVHHKINRNKLIIAYNRINIRKQPVGQLVGLSGKKHGKNIVIFKNPPVHDNVKVIVKEDLKELRKIEYIKGLTASIDNSFIPLLRNNSTGYLLKKRDVTEQSEVLTGTQLSGCDTIYLKSGSLMIVKVTEIRQNEIRYKNCNTLNGPIASIPKSDVSAIKSANSTLNYNISGDMIAVNDSNITRVNEGFGLVGFVLGMIDLVVGLSMIATTPVSLAWLVIILGYSGLGLIVFILGCTSYAMIKRHPEKYKGKGFATVCIIQGLIEVFAFIYLLIRWLI
ncbi:MAG: hypothetical protein WA816_09030 [Bacteroidales bacterium]